jgi:hypothetical protein
MKTLKEIKVNNNYETEITDSDGIKYNNCSIKYYTEDFIKFVYCTELKLIFD